MSLDAAAQLQVCLSSIRDGSTTPETEQAFARWRDRFIAEHPGTEKVVDLLWNEALAARRSAAFWQEICDVEKELSQRIAANHIQLRQNYLRLMQEQ